MLHVKGNHLAQAEAEHRDGFSGLGGQGIEVEHEDADQRVGKDERDGAGARRDLAEGGANGSGDRLRRAQIGLADAGNERAGGSGSKA